MPTRPPKTGTKSMRRPHALVTGAASGIGAHLVERLLSAGWAVAAADLVFSASSGTNSFASAAEHYQTLPLDVRVEADWMAALDQATEAFGPLDLLVNNAGVIVPGRVHESPTEAMVHQVDVNLKGVMLGTRLAAARMLQTRQKGAAGRPSEGRSENGDALPKGHIINVASLAGVAPVPGLGAYSASKFGVRAWSLVAAEELRKHGIAVTVLCPDLVDTPMLDAQLEYPEAAITFSGPKALTVARIGDALMQCLESKPRELLVPSSRGWLSKLASAFPGLMPMLRRRLEHKGRRQQARYREQAARKD